MSKKEVWIFGDSYSDPTYPFEEGTQTWPNVIKNIYDVYNDSMSGVGLNFLIDKLYKKIKKTDKNKLSNITILFFAGHSLRMDFEFLKQPHHSNGIYTWIVRDLEHEKNIYNDIKYYIEYKEQLKWLYKNYAFMYSNYQYESIKSLSLLKLLSLTFKKILFWPTGRLNQKCISETLFQSIVSPVNDEKFYFIHKVANDIFPTNLYKPPFKNTYGNDLRPNHVPIEQHSIFLEQLCNWIDNNKKIDFTVFK